MKTLDTREGGWRRFCFREVSGRALEEIRDGEFKIVTLEYDI